MKQIFSDKYAHDWQRQEASLNNSKLIEEETVLYREIPHGSVILRPKVIWRKEQVEEFERSTVSARLLQRRGIGNVPPREPGNQQVAAGIVINLEETFILIVHTVASTLSPTHPAKLYWQHPTRNRPG